MARRAGSLGGKPGKGSSKGAISVPPAAPPAYNASHLPKCHTPSSPNPTSSSSCSASSVSPASQAQPSPVPWLWRSDPHARLCPGSLAIHLKAQFPKGVPCPQVDQEPESPPRVAVCRVLWRETDTQKGPRFPPVPLTAVGNCSLSRFSSGIECHVFSAPLRLLTLRITCVNRPFSAS